MRLTSVHFILPGLFWPSPEWQAMSTPSLDSLAARGRQERVRAPGWEAALAGFLGLPSGLAHAPLRLAAEADAPDARTGPWLCADPGHLRLNRDTLVLVEGGSLAIHADEASAMVADLNRHFADAGTFVAPDPARWYLRPNGQAQVTLAPLSVAAGRNIQPLLPDGPDGRVWRRLFNEIQVYLHNHAVNQRREAEGKPVVNTVWFWGNGLAPTMNTPGPAAPATDAPRPADAPLYADSAFARGLARHAGHADQDLPGGFEQMLTAKPEGAVTVVLEALHPHFLYQDGLAWTDTLARLEADWFAPALSALTGSRLAEIHLSAVGDAETLNLHVRRRDMLRFWRSSRFSNLLKPDGES